MMTGEITLCKVRICDNRYTLLFAALVHVCLVIQHPSFELFSIYNEDNISTLNGLNYSDIFAFPAFGLQTLYKSTGNPFSGVKNEYRRK